MNKLRSRFLSPDELQFELPYNTRLILTDSHSTLVHMKTEFDDLTPEWQRKFLTTLITEKLDQ